MATAEECEIAMHRLAGRLHVMDTETKRRTVLDRSVTCHLSDLGITFRGHLRDGSLEDIRRTASSDGQIRLDMASDDLIELVDGSLHFAKAWATGRIKVQASVFDLLKLRTLL